MNSRLGVLTRHKVTTRKRVPGADWDGFFAALSMTPTKGCAAPVSF